MIAEIRTKSLQYTPMKSNKECETSEVFAFNLEV